MAHIAAYHGYDHSAMMRRFDELAEMPYAHLLPENYRFTRMLGILEPIEAPVSLEFLPILPLRKEMRSNSRRLGQPRRLSTLEEEVGAQTKVPHWQKWLPDYRFGRRRRPPKSQSRSVASSSPGRPHRRLGAMESTPV